MTRIYKIERCVFNMRKIFICLLVLVVFLTGCSQIHEGKTESETPAPAKEDDSNHGGNDVNSDSNYIHKTELETPAPTKEDDSNHGGDDVNSDSNYIYECEAPGVFSYLNDFYKFATSGSRNPKDYVDSYTSENIQWYASVDSHALLKIEDMFDDTDIIDDVEKIVINYEANNYTYVLKSGVTVNVTYAPKSMAIGTMTDIVCGDKTEFVQDVDNNRFSIASTDGKIYVMEVNGITINRQMKKSLNVNYFSFTTLIDEYQISVETYWADKYSSQDQLLNDPTNQFVKLFLTDSDLSVAVSTLKSCIKSKK